jgi:isoleucyl-tRNA synthetase
VDRFALARYAVVSARVRAAYEAYDFQTIFHALNEFMTVDLSAFYLDVSKDRLYTFAADAVERRSAQTAQYVIADGLTRLMAPILSITADEIWTRLPGARDASVHLAEFATGPDVWRDDALVGRWERLLGIRDRVNAALEAARQEKTIGNALSAHVTVTAEGDDADLLVRYTDDLAMVFITSTVTVDRGNAFAVAVERAAGDKCPRCWRFVTERQPEGEAEGLCVRCVDAVGDLDAVAG